MNLNIDVRAYFKLTAVNAVTKVARELTGWFPNLVLDAGRDRMSQGAWISRVMVGSGNSTPVVTQTSLDNFIASTTSMTEYSSTRQLTTLPYYYSLKTTFRFAQGAAAGNLSEIAMGWADNACWNRALIKDLNGNPTTITIRANEYLDVYTELRIYPNTSDVVLNNVPLKDESGNTISTHTVTIRPNMSTDLIHSATYKTFSFPVRLADSINSTTSSISVFGSNGVLNTVTQQPSGTSTGTLTGVAANNSYPTPRSCVYNAPMTITQLNGVHKIVRVDTRLGSWKFEYNPPIVKDGTQTLQHNFSLTWDRYTP